MTAPDQNPVHATQEEIAEDWRLPPVRATRELARKLGLRRDRRGGQASQVGPV